MVLFIHRTVRLIILRVTDLAAASLDGLLNSLRALNRHSGQFHLPYRVGSK
jgi:hypothetical protein